MSKNNLLGIDLNEVANEAISKKINDLEAENDLLGTDIAALKSQLRTVNKKFEEYKSNSKLVMTVFQNIRNTYAALKSAPETRDSYAKSLDMVKYEFIRDIMLFIFGVKEAHGYVKGSLGRNLAANFYDNKNDVISILDLLGQEENHFQSVQSKIREFVHPKDFTKEQVMKYAKSPNYNTNGNHNGYDPLIKGYGIPHDMIQSNPIMIEDDVFTEVIESIRNRRGTYNLLFDMHKNASLSDSQIKLMGDLVPVLLLEKRKSDEMTRFTEKNLHKFNDSTIRVLFDNYASKDNQFKTFHWEKFPVKYQHEYLLKRPIQEVLGVISHYSCSWSDKEKDEFLKRYYRG